MLSNSNRPMTKRQYEVLRLVIEGKTSQQIADELGLSIYTVSNHRKNILQKANCSNVIELMRWSMQNNLMK